MELKPEDLKNRAEALRKELTAFAQKAQADVNAKQAQINALQTQLQNAIQAAQKHIDQQDGKIAGLLELAGEPVSAGKITELPDHTKGKEPLPSNAPKNP